jgi:hypothetical protein
MWSLPKVEFIETESEMVVTRGFRGKSRKWVNVS